MFPIDEEAPETPEQVVASVLAGLEAGHRARRARTALAARAARLAVAEQSALELAARRFRHRAHIRAYYKVAGPIEY